MDLGIVAQGLKVAHTLHGTRDGFLIIDPLVVQGDIQAEPLLDQAAEDLQLDPAHDLDMDLASGGQDVELRVFLLQLPQLGQHHRRIAALGQIHPVGHDGLQQGGLSFGLRPQSLSGIGIRQAGDGAEGAGRRFLRGGEFVAGVQPELNDLFFLAVTFQVYIIQN